MNVKTKVATTAESVPGTGIVITYLSLLAVVALSYPPTGERNPRSP